MSDVRPEMSAARVPEPTPPPIVAPPKPDDALRSVLPAASAASPSGCPDCGWSFASCDCYEDDPEGDDDFDCTHCGGEGTCEAGCDPGWYDDIHPCHACNGTGKRRDQVIF